MQLKNRTSEIFIPDGAALDKALGRTTHMGIGAHQDDLEIMTYDGILRCFGHQNRWFWGITVTNGKDSPRTGIYSNFSDEDMQKVRKDEQKKAAVLGEYSGIALLDYPSSVAQNPGNNDLKEHIKTLISAARPSIIYTHNPADKHDAHIAVMLRTIQALRELPDNLKPEKVYGCEVWRDLDWMVDEDKVAFDVSENENFAISLLGLFDSQICGGKQYDLATMGRRRANATYSESHGVDTANLVIYGINLTPLIWNSQQSMLDYIVDYIERFKTDVTVRLNKLS